jgi:hypothetical protein
MEKPRNKYQAVLELAKAERLNRENTDPEQLGPMLKWDEWIASPYYSGNFSSELYPYWKKKISTFCNNQATELVITGCIGGGKTWASNALVAYKIYCLSRYRYPQRLFGLGSYSTLLFAYLTTTQKQAQLAGFAELRDAIDAMPYFRNEFPRNMEISTVLEWQSHKIKVVGGSSAQDVISMNLFGIILDELNFYRKGGSGSVGDVQKAQDDYANTTHRRRSRFVHGGIDYSFSILISSATVDSSFTNKRIKEGKENKQLKQQIVDVKQWEAKEGVETFSDINFAVFGGNDTTDPKLISNPADFLDICSSDDKETERVSQALNKPDVTIDDVFEALSSEYRERCVLIPMDYYVDFQTDLLKAIQNVAGMSVGDSRKFFSSRVLWNLSCAKVPELKHPFTREILQITIQTPHRMEDNFLPEVLFDLETRKFRRHPDAKRYVHIDQSESGDLTGIGMVHFAELSDINSGLRLPTLELDFALGISNTVRPDRIDLAKVLDFFIWLRREYKIKYGKISYDKFASNYQIQMLEKMNIITGLTSVDKDDLPWKMFRSLLDEQRFNQYFHKHFQGEIFELIHDRVKQKVDHKTDGSKDVSDGVVGAVFDCISDIDNRMLEAPEAYKENLKLFGPNRHNDSSVLSARSDWVFADYEQRMGKKITALGNADELRKQEVELASQ